MDHGTALTHVCQRVDVRGHPLFDIARQRSELIEWVNSNVGSAMAAESGICRWEEGNIDLAVNDPFPNRS